MKVPLTGASGMLGHYVRYHSRDTEVVAFSSFSCLFMKNLWISGNLRRRHVQML